MAKNIGKFFKNYRFMHNLNQRDLASSLKMSQPYLACIESGKELIPINACKSLYELCSKDEKIVLLNCINEDIKNILN